ncbi:DNA recombination protein RecF [Chryseobacterium sp. Leaf180]|uniref:DNA replication/repair protein RecF n=1 Tax=Chryseobacterium sp. Leaf180 TaxID=1736289 RepID=UPI0006F27330|nr:DNA replication/repair protein RecF [Chryseobacterium sp. Leaf180]KQR91454.1 DNA recombination protein RecF [Chryseobacterium sp. Leaf180]
MIIKKLSLYNFKNHDEQKFDLSPQINCFVGNNGAGKTNILDALYYLSVGKSFLGSSDILNIKNGEDFFSIDAEVLSDENEDVIKISQPKEGKKIIRKNGKNYDRMADHIGYLPSVMISPYDSNLISDSGESRRKFLDSMISQTDSEYLFDLIQYQKTIQQRNALLKYFAKNRIWERDSLEIYDEPIVKLGTKIFEKRSNFVSKLNPVVSQFYEVISGGKETVRVQYASHLSEDSFQNLLDKNIEKDRVLTYTSQGIHKDDLLFEMDSQLIKKIGSQGQQKSFLISLKLAQMNLIKQLTNKTPILLLDDIFDKLDDLRVAQLINLVNKENFGQIFITDTHRERTENIVKKINEESIIFEI